ncbi:MAG: hypothetical protein JST55_14545 [Bacteroidetes bacterium]|nr:hypothetical protein [Bacteroidota bacterium]
MPLSGKPAPTSLQVGSEAYFIYNNVLQKAKIVSTSTEVTNPNSDSSGVTKTIYHLEGFSRPFESEYLFSSYQLLLTYQSTLVGILIDFPGLTPSDPLE